MSYTPPTPTTSAALRDQITDETGTGALVFGTTPTIATPLLTLSTTTDTAEGRIAWDATTDQIEVGTGSRLAVFSADSIATTIKWGN